MLKPRILLSSSACKQMTPAQDYSQSQCIRNHVVLSLHSRRNATNQNTHQRQQQQQVQQPQLLCLSLLPCISEFFVGCMFSQSLCI
jgi:hypothetical protein